MISNTVRCNKLFTGYSANISFLTCMGKKETQKKKRNRSSALDVIRIGFKPMTPNLEGLCSIQLSYRTIFQIILLKGCKYKFFRIAVEA